MKYPSKDLAWLATAPCMIKHDTRTLLSSRMRVHTKCLPSPADYRGMGRHLFGVLPLLRVHPARKLPGDRTLRSAGGLALPFAPSGGPSSASVGLADHPQVDMLGVWRKPVNFGGEKSSVSPNCWTLETPHRLRQATAELFYELLCKVADREVGPCHSSDHHRLTPGQQ